METSNLTTDLSHFASPRVFLVFIEFINDEIIDEDKTTNLYSIKFFKLYKSSKIIRLNINQHMSRPYANTSSKKIN